MSQSSFYVERGSKFDSKVPPSLPTNKPIYLGTKTDEEIIEHTEYEFTVSVKVLLTNSKKNRRPRRNSGPPRPQNPFILYRRDKVKKHENEFSGLKSSVVSQKVGEMWNNETPEVKRLFGALSRMSEKIHTREYGDYKYKPKPKKARNDRERNSRYSPYSPIPDSPASDNMDNFFSSSISNSSNDDDIIFDFITFDEPDESYDMASNFSTLGDITLKEPSNTSGTLGETASNEPSNISGTLGETVSNEPSNISDIFGDITSDTIALNEPNYTPLCLDALGNMVPTEFNTTSLGNNSNDIFLSFGNFYTSVGPINLQVAPFVQFDEKFMEFAYRLYNYISTNPNPPMRLGADNTAFLGSAFDEPNHIGNY